MQLLAAQSNPLRGEIVIPGSKSHTIRALVIASLAEGKSEILNPLYSDDTAAAINGCATLGATIKSEKDRIEVIGVGKQIKEPATIINTLNSGTSTNIISGVSALGTFEVNIDGDSSIQQRPVKPLLDALTNLGVKAKSIKNNGCPPLTIQGPLRGGKTDLFAKSSQYLTSLLLSCPLAEGDTEIEVKELCEIPYIYLTLSWLREQNIKFEFKEDLSYFYIHGRQQYHPFTKAIPADWSSAAFPIVAATIVPGSDILVRGLDLNDSQGDKVIVDYINEMGGNISVEPHGLRIKSSKLIGKEIDLNDTPDALPAVAILGCFAEGQTIIKNVAHARIKETDRIKVMHEELSKMGASIEEKPDGLVIKQSNLQGTTVTGHHDHRVVMALSLAGIASLGATIIDTAEAVEVTFPNYIEKMTKINAQMSLV